MRKAGEKAEGVTPLMREAVSEAAVVRAVVRRTGEKEEKGRMEKDTRGSASTVTKLVTRQRNVGHPQMAEEKEKEVWRWRERRRRLK